MAGTTGKRARAPEKCFRCGGKIYDSTFERDCKGDSHSMNADGSYPCLTKRRGLRCCWCDCVDTEEVCGCC